MPELPVASQGTALIFCPSLWHLLCVGKVRPVTAAQPVGTLAVPGADARKHGAHLELPLSRPGVPRIPASR